MRPPRVGSWLLAVALLFCAGCSAPVPPEPDPGGRASVSPEPDEGVKVLAKADGWRAPLGTFYGVVEIAYDEVAAKQAWAENVPADLVRRSGDPEQPGLYGDLADIDFAREALVVYSSGQSGTCPGWLTGIEVAGPGTVQITTTFTSATFATVQGERVGDCTADYSPYRIVLSIDRDRLPPVSALPTTSVLFNGEQLGDGGLVTTYPAEPDSGVWPA
jgi:hypothetical protein